MEDRSVPWALKLLAIVLFALSLWPFKAWFLGVFQKHVWQLGRAGYAVELRGPEAVTYGWMMLGTGTALTIIGVVVWIWAKKIDD